MDDNEFVLYTSTFSKTVVPAMRIGWITGPHQLIRMMSQAKQAADLHSNSLTQHALVHMMRDFDLDAHIRRLIGSYHERMLIMKELLEKVEGGRLSYFVPKGGMFFWVNMPEHVDTTKLLSDAVDEGVAFVPGKPFYVAQPQANTLRLNFTHAEPDLIRLGMERLVSVMNRLHEPDVEKDAQEEAVRG
jgi:2-aminoadipate transaminase